MNLLLAVIRRGYAEFEQRAGNVKSKRGAKAELVHHRHSPATAATFSFPEIERVCPGVGREWILLFAQRFNISCEVSCRGKGPAARWRYLGSKGINT